MEYCSGGDLAHLLRRVKRLPERGAQTLMRQLAAGLRHMWAHHLVHVSGRLCLGLKPRWCAQLALQPPTSPSAAAPPCLPPLCPLQRDLKPQNLLLSSTGADAVLKIADFGFARNLQPQVRGAVSESSRNLL